MNDFTRDGNSRFELTNDMIDTKTLQLGVPSSTTPLQWIGLNSAIVQAQALGIKVVVTQIKK
jgi:hypothetical protein